MHNEITYKRIQSRDIEIIKPLWEKLLLHHQEKSADFKYFYSTFTFEIRIKNLVALPDDNLFIETAEDESGVIAGYCITSIKADGTGELDSIYIEDSFRTRGIGGRLVNDSLEWMKKRGCTKITVSVANGNEEAMPFYEKFGFRHRLSVLELRK
jgi:diamine N-acetyltransferase